MTTRVEDLESEIAELRAAVNGLTEELVETKARVRELEDAAEADRTAAAEAAAGETTTKSDDHVEVVEHNNTDSDSPEAASEGNNSSASTDSTDELEADSSEIIIA